MSKFWVEETHYKVVVEVDGKEETHEATIEDDHSPMPESMAHCSCGFSYGPKRNGAYSALHEHFSDLGVSDVKPTGTRTRPI